MKHALLRLGPNTTLPSPCFPSLRFPSPSISLTHSLQLFPVLCPSLQAGASNRSSYWRLRTSPITSVLSLSLTQVGVCSLSSVLSYFPLHPQLMLKLQQFYSSSAYAPYLDMACWFVFLNDRPACSLCFMLCEQLILRSLRSCIALMPRVRVEFRAN